MEQLEAKVKRALERAGYTSDSLLVVAVSGGSDSLALLYSLLSLGEGACPRLHVAHLNHNFREEAEEDAHFVTTVAGQLGLPVTVEKANPVAYQKEMGISSFEEAAREVRYSFLARVARDRAAAVALGHTADDLAETVLLHIIRGSGIHGLRGMAELSTWQSRTGSQNAVLFRPLLEVTKKETIAYCQNRGIVFREDPGNRLPRFTRNRVRHELLPTLGGYNPRIRGALVRLAHSASLEVDYLEKEVTRVWPTVARHEGDSLVLDAGLLASLHPLMQRMMFRRAYQQLVGDTRRLEEAHLKAATSFIGAPAGKVLDLPRGLQLHTGYGQLVLSQGPEVTSPFPALEGEHEILLPSSLPSPCPADIPLPAGEGLRARAAMTDESITEIPGWRVIARVVPSSEATAGNRLLPPCGGGLRRGVSTPHPSLPPQGGKEPDPFTASFAREAIGDRLRVRTRLPGDRFQPLGMRAEKKLQDFFVDEKVPRAWRDRIPLVVSEGGIAWVMGYRMAEWARVRQDSRLVLWVGFELQR